MKALTKGQYEVLAGVLRSNKANIGNAFTKWEAICFSMARLFAESDPEFKRELFLEQCGVTE